MMKILMFIFMMIVAIVELFIIAGCFVTVKYEIEMTTDMSVILSAVYSMLNTLSLIIILDLLYLGVMYILYLKKTKRG